MHQTHFEALARSLKQPTSYVFFVLFCETDEEANAFRETKLHVQAHLSENWTKRRVCWELENKDHGLPTKAQTPGVSTSL